MTPLDPFAYPSVPRAPLHAPAGYRDPSSYKPWLRDDFAFRCLYCLVRERWHARPLGHDSFGVAHVIGRAAATDLTTDYANLVYSCNACNYLKGEKPLPVDPLADPLGHHLAVGDDGSVVALTARGGELISLFDLNDANRVASRREKLDIIRVKVAEPHDPVIDRIFRRAFGYPDDLPDLAALRPPGGNAHAGSEAASHFARRARGELPAVY